MTTELLDIFMPPAVTDRSSGGIVFWLCIWVHASFVMCIARSSLARYLKNQWVEFHQTFVDDVAESTEWTDRILKFVDSRLICYSQM